MADSLTDVARALSVSPATLRRWVAEGIVPLQRRGVDAGGARPGPDRGADARPRALAGAAAGRGEGGPARVRVPGGPLPGARRCAAHLGGGGRGDRDRARADPPHLGGRGLSLRVGGAAQRRRHRAAAAVRRGAGRRAAAGRVPADRARVRAGARADRRRRGQALPPLRPRADDPRRLARARDGRGAVGPGGGAAAADRADHGLGAHAAAAPLPRAGRRRAPGGGHRRRGARAAAGGDRVRRPRRLHAAHRGGG